MRSPRASVYGNSGEMEKTLCMRIVVRWPRASVYENSGEMAVSFCA